MSSINVNISEILLNGIIVHNERHFVNALERELLRLVNDHGIPQAWIDSKAVTDLQGGSFGVLGNTTDDEIGVKIAETIYGGIK